jgi:hypothetical protein
MNREVVLSARQVRAHVASGKQTVVDTNGVFYAVQDEDASSLFMTAWCRDDLTNLPAPGDVLVLSSYRDGGFAGHFGVVSVEETYLRSLQQRRHLRTLGLRCSK